MPSHLHCLSGGKRKIDQCQCTNANDNIYSHTYVRTQSERYGQAFFSKYSCRREIFIIYQHLLLECLRMDDLVFPQALTNIHKNENYGPKKKKKKIIQTSYFTPCLFLLSEKGYVKIIFHFHLLDWYGKMKVMMMMMMIVMVGAKRSNKGTVSSFWFILIVYSIYSSTFSFLYTIE